MLTLGVTVQTAEGEDANRLRAIRTAFFNGMSSAAFIPIEQPDRSRYTLQARDVVQFETADGEPFVPWVDVETL